MSDYDRVMSGMNPGNVAHYKMRCMACRGRFCVEHRYNEQSLEDFFREASLEHQKECKNPRLAIEHAECFS